MKIKVCAKCKFKESVAREIAPRNMAMVWVCKHPECVDPITGEPLQCNVARQQPVFCGIEAHHYEELVDPKPVEGDVKQNVIQLIDR